MAQKVETPEEVDARIKKATEHAEKQAVMPGHVFVDVSAGPYAGKRLQVPEAEASTAVSEGWASKLGEEAEAKELSPEEVFELNHKAREGARRLRGEDKDDDDKKAKRAKADRNETRQVEAEDEDKGSYQTRDVRSKK